MLEISIKSTKGRLDMLSLVVPTYNEKENIGKLIEELRAALAGVETELIVVDDGSPDGTGEVVQGLEKTYSGRGVTVRLIQRGGKKGLSSAVLDGWREAKGDVLGVMDADFSHPPAKVKEMYRQITEGCADLVVGSRYGKGGHIENWPLKRRIISKGATLLARPVTACSDPMSGFFLFRRNVIEGVELNDRGFKIGLEVLAKGRYGKLVEVAYTFRDRKVGKSKMVMKEIWHYFWQVVGLWF